MTDKPQSPSAPSEAQVCSICGHRNRAGVLTCENCGAQIMVAGSPSLKSSSQSPTPEKTAAPTDSSAQPTPDAVTPHDKPPTLPSLVSTSATDKPTAPPPSAAPASADMPPAPTPAVSTPAADKPTAPPPSAAPASADMPPAPTPAVSTPAADKPTTPPPPAVVMPAVTPPITPAAAAQPVASPTHPAALSNQPDPGRSTVTFTPDDIPQPKPTLDITDTGDQKMKSPSPTCPNCGHTNRQGILVCENCGTNLLTGERPRIATHNFRGQEASAGVSARPLDATGTEDHLSTDEIKAVTTAGSNIFEEGMALRLEVEGAATPILVYPSQETIIGRRDPVTGSMPDVDMTAYAGYRMGVSRKHAAIRLQDRKLDIRDLGSGNGTFVNGIRLSAHQPHTLRDGDEITLGKMMVRVFFQSKRL